MYMGFLWKKLQKEDHLSELGVNVRISKLILKKQHGRAWTGEHGNKLSGSVKCVELLD
jgi:hypothetical protein